MSKQYAQRLKAAHAGDVDAMFEVAHHIVFEDFTTPIPPEQLALAQGFYRSACAAGDHRSMLDVGDMYRFGKYVPKSVDIAFHIYNRCYNHIDEDPWCLPDVSLRLGNCYRSGEGTSPSPLVAEKLLRQAMEGFEKRVAEGDQFSASSLKHAKQAWEEVSRALEGQGE